MRVRRNTSVEIPSAMNFDQSLLAMKTNTTDESTHATAARERRPQANTKATASYMAPSDTYKLSYTVGGAYLDQSADQGRNGDQLSQSTTFDMAKASPSDISGKHWTPVWLRRCTLIAFAALFAVLAAALVVLWFANKHQNGFSTTLGTNHYAWTYGPTAILVIVLSLWRQVEYHCKLLQPWQELRKGSAEAERSMLLDYLSPLQVTSFVRAVRYRHTLVAV